MIRRRPAGADSPAKTPAWAPALHRGRGRARAGTPEALLRDVPRRRQDLRHARGRAPAPRRGAGGRRRPRRDPRAPRNRGAARGARGPAASPGQPPRPGVRGVRSRRRARAQPASDPRRRTGAHERPRLAPHQALAGRRGTDRRGDRRLHHPQRPALGELERRRRADHRPGDPGDRPRHLLAARRRDRAGRPAARGSAPAPARGEGLPRRDGGARRRLLLPHRQPHRPARAGAAARRRARRRADAGLSRAPRDPGRLGGGRAAARRDQLGPDDRTPPSGDRAARDAVARRVDRRLRRDPGRVGAASRRTAPGSSRTCGSRSRSAPRRSRAPARASPRSCCCSPRSATSPRSSSASPRGPGGRSGSRARWSTRWRGAPATWISTSSAGSAPN